MNSGCFLPCIKKQMRRLFARGVLLSACLPKQVFMGKYSRKSCFLLGQGYYVLLKIKHKGFKLPVRQKIRIYYKF